MNQPASAKPRRLPLRFSLRVLLVAFTAFAIGFPIWYRWPYEEEKVQDSSRDPFSAFKEMRIVSTWQRQWGGGRLKHGVERVVGDGKTLHTTAFHLGQKHGLYQHFYLSGPLAEEGHFTNGEKDGVWTAYDEAGSAKSTTTWRNGRLEGPATFSRRTGNHQLVFAADRIVSVDGRPVEDRLGAILAADKVSSPEIVSMLNSGTGANFIDLPVGFVVDNLSQNLRVPMVADPFHVDPNVRVNFNGDMPMAASLTIMAAEHGLACDYRYGCVWITSAENAKNWRDPTGTLDLTPPADSQLARSWNEPVAVLAAKQPLAQALSTMTSPLAIAVDTSQISPVGEGDADYPVTLKVSALPFRGALGVLLYQTRCRVKLDGETLVILPPE